MLKATQTLCSKASRLPLNSKKANKDFYKGTRTGSIMKSKRIASSNPQGEQLYDTKGRKRYWHLKTHRIDEARVTNYVVPPGLAETTLRPYVFAGPKDTGGMGGFKTFGMPGYPKMSKEGFDGTYYRTIVADMLSKRRIKEEQSSELQSTNSKA